MSQYPEYKNLDLPHVAKTVMEEWKANQIFEKSIAEREGCDPFVFFEGPPSANGKPGIHHAMGRTIKDIFCRFKTLKGFQVHRKAGWDTHGLPVELSVEKELGITKEDIGKKINVEDYNKACKETVMRYTDVWSELTEQIGYWVDMDDPYVTYENKYIESVWWLLKRTYDNNLLYKGYTIQPYSPAAGTGLSSHELNQPGCYKDVKDTTVVAQFELEDSSIEKFKAHFSDVSWDTEKVHLLAWTTTPWTLPSNTALCVGKKIDYVVVRTFNQYTGEPITVVVAEALLNKHFPEKNASLTFEEFKIGSNKLPFKVLGNLKGVDLVGLRYKQLLPFVQPFEDADAAFQVISGDFVTTEDGTGIVHIAPTFGADDAAVARDAGVPPMLIIDDAGNPVPLVDMQGKFRPEMGEFAGMFVKNEYYAEGERPDKSVDVQIAIKLKEENKAFRVEKYEHSYPHCWRTDKPVLYYPLDSWFVKITEVKNRMVELNKTINWKPKSTGEGRFGNWLENASDWNLSRSRFWGIPLPIWRTEDGDEELCIGSVEQLKAECEKAIAAGLLEGNPFEAYVSGNNQKQNYESFDLHKNFVDKIVLVSDSGKPMFRESDLIDVWFDSGAMPYAQWHYPFENKDFIDQNKKFPADFIAEGVDQTRGWFYTLHAIGTMCFDSVAYKNVLSNGLVLDKNGLKMSKRLGNGVDPFEVLNTYGADATRWYMITNAQPWDNLKFDQEGIVEVQRKFFGTIFNTYGFFSLYANIDKFNFNTVALNDKAKPEIDRWILSKLNSLIKEVERFYGSYEPTSAGRLIQEFVIDHLSNWYVRLCRRRFWKGEFTQDKISAYHTLYTCLKNIAIIASPIAPFYMDKLYKDLCGKSGVESVHLANFPTVNQTQIDIDLEQRMEIAQKVCSLVLGIRKKEQIKVRQPLQKLMVPALDEKFAQHVESVKDLVLAEVNIKELEILRDTTGVFTKKIKPNFKTIGKKYGKHMKAIVALTSGWGQEEIIQVESNKGWNGVVNDVEINLELEDFEISTEDVPGWLVSSEGPITVALDMSLSQELKDEGIAREFVNRIQNMRKQQGLSVTDHIDLKIESHNLIDNAINENLNYICAETLANSLELVNVAVGETVELNEEIRTVIALTKSS